MIELCAGEVVATVDPARGGRLTGLIIGGFDVISAVEPEPGRPSSWFDGSFPLAPWAGILVDGRIDFEGVSRVIDADAAGTFFHGVAHDAPWRVLSSNPSGMRLGLELPDRWPFGGRLEQEYELADGMLTHTLTAINDQHRMPVTLGMHPWFPTSIGDGAAEIGFSPTAEFSPGDAVADGRFSDRPWDAAFTGLAHDPTIGWPGGPRLTLSSSSDVWVYYEQTPAAFCIEPWTAPPGALGLGLGQVASPGDPVSLVFRLSWEQEHGV